MIDKFSKVKPQILEAARKRKTQEHQNAILIRGNELKFKAAYKKIYEFLSHIAFKKIVVDLPEDYKHRILYYTHYFPYEFVEIQDTFFQLNCAERNKPDISTPPIDV